ncbi:hypothetical protein XM53_01535 [Roseovarius atlanticus]|uniref:Uncharacterized protein n=1 Tax=Roseovarius atlanticus TaxID=1641875 RepID=A0A0T5NZX3_9RHOB|nr:hypothetical protein [Roseovarius atlanticus]KRS14433.1 hypothetical protein XM53_01535 [Roseovarius atlanticus]
MQSRPDNTPITRHARLFELLRQENVARRVRDRADAGQIGDGNAALAFRELAELSFEARPAVL